MQRVISGVANVKESWPGWAMQVLLQLRLCITRRSWRALYIHGKPGVGKSFIVGQAIHELGCERVFMSVPGSFFFGNFKNESYDIIVFEEFEYDTYKSNFWQIKRVIEGKSIGVDCKNETPRCIKVKRPVLKAYGGGFHVYVS